MPDVTHLCLLGRRFRVATSWEAFDGSSGEEWRYDNPLATAFPAVLDSQAFATCGLP